MTTYEKIKELCEKEGFPISAIGKTIPGLSLSKASITGWKNGSKPRPEKIRLIADYFGVSIEYLTNDDATNIQTVQDNHGIIGDTHAPVTIMNGSTSLTEQETELLNLFRKLSVLKQSQLIVKAAEMVENENQN